MDYLLCSSVGRSSISTTARLLVNFIRPKKEPNVYEFTFDTLSMQKCFTLSSNNMSPHYIMSLTYYVILSLVELII